MSKPSVYRIIFHKKGETYELYVRRIVDSDLVYGFIEVEGFVFGTRSQTIVDPGEERLKNEFQGVKRSFIPMHTITRIDEVEKEGISKVIPGGRNKISPLPLPGKQGGPLHMDSEDH